MKNIKKLMIVVLIIMYTAGCGPKKPVLEMKEEKISWEKNALDAEAEIIISKKEGNFCIIKPEEWSSVIIPEKYLIRPIAYTGTTYRVERRDDEYRVKETERYEVGVYDFHTLKLIKILDMKKIMEPYMEEWKIWTTGCGTGEYNGKYYITSNVEKKQTDEEIIAEKEEELRELWIDIENEKAFWNDNESVLVKSKNNENIWMLIGTMILDVNGYKDVMVYNHGVLKDTSYIVMPTNKLPEKNEKLYTLFPELKNVSREEGMYAHIYLHPRTDNMEAISLILNDGDRLNFDVLEPDSYGYYGGYGKNGERHDITKEEYEQFQRDYEEYFGKEE